MSKSTKIAFTRFGDYCDIQHLSSPACHLSTVCASVDLYWAPARTIEVFAFVQNYLFLMRKIFRPMDTNRLNS